MFVLVYWDMDIFFLSLSSLTFQSTSIQWVQKTSMSWPQTWSSMVGTKPQWRTTLTYKWHLSKFGLNLFHSKGIWLSSVWSVVVLESDNSFVAFEFENKHCQLIKQNAKVQSLYGDFVRNKFWPLACVFLLLIPPGNWWLPAACLGAITPSQMSCSSAQLHFFGLSLC